MTQHKTVNACLILIGNELLSGRTQDKNLSYIAKELNELGIQLARAHVIPDEKEIIVKYLNKCRQDYDYVFTTGGIGPTHDDITSECVAEAFGVPMVRDPETAALMTKRVEERGEVMNEARLRMATFPKGSTLLPNSISAAPGYCMENVFVMAGGPRVMRVMFEQETPYDEIRIMDRYELKSFIRENRSIQKVIMRGNYSEKDRVLSSQVIYAKNLLRLM